MAYSRWSDDCDIYLYRSDGAYIAHVASTTTDPETGVVEEVNFSIRHRLPQQMLIACERLRRDGHRIDEDALGRLRADVLRQRSKVTT